MLSMRCLISKVTKMKVKLRRRNAINKSLSSSTVFYDLSFSEGSRRKWRRLYRLRLRSMLPLVSLNNKRVSIGTYSKNLWLKKETQSPITRISSYNSEKYAIIHICSRIRSLKEQMIWVSILSSHLERWYSLTSCWKKALLMVTRPLFSVDLQLCLTYLRTTVTTDNSSTVGSMVTPH